MLKFPDVILHSIMYSITLHVKKNKNRITLNMLLKFFHFITFSENSIGTATHFKHALKAFLKCVKFETKLSKYVDLVPHLTLCASI